MNKLKKYFNGRLFYALSLGILVAAVAATGAMIIDGNRADEGESQYLSMDESASQVVIGNTEAKDPEPEVMLPADEIIDETEAVDAVPETTVAETAPAEIKPVEVAAKPTEEETA